MFNYILYLHDILQDMKFEHKKTELENGLSVIEIPMETESVGIELSVRVGSRDESEDVNGISHFLEHMVFKGTEKWRTAMDMNRVIESVGGVFNAFTSREHTGFWVKIAKKHWKLGLEYVYQSVFKPLLPEVELEKERGVILEEIKMYQDNPMSLVGREFAKQMYGGTALGRHVIGKAENIKRLEKKEFDSHLQEWYQPKNMALGIAGGMEGDIEEAVKEIFKADGGGEVKLGDKPELFEFEQSKLVRQVINKEIEQAHFCLGVRTFERGNKDRYVLAVLNTILGGNSSSRLWEEIREKRGLVYYVRSGIDSFMETGHLVTQAGCDRARIDEALKVTLGEYMRMKDKGVTEGELKLAKEYLKGRLALSLEDSQEVAGVFSESLVLENKVRTVEEVIAGVEAVKKEDVLRVAKRIFKKEMLNLTVVGKFKEKDRFEKII